MHVECVHRMAAVRRDENDQRRLGLRGQFRQMGGEAEFAADEDTVQIPVAELETVDMAAPAAPPDSSLQ